MNEKIAIKTKAKREIIDITDTINSILSSFTEENGLCNIFVTHTTCAITTADLDPGTEQDYINVFEKIIPNIKFNHPHDPSHMPDHILSTIIGTSIVLPFNNHSLALGTWQKVVLVEFNGPQTRNISLSFF